MLVANKKGSPFIISPNLTRLELLNLRENETFHCPQCQERVMLKVGRVKAPHFSHLPQSTCVNLFAEGESYNHLIGKYSLYSFFKNRHLSVELEAFLPTIAQRPDLLIQVENQTYAIEFQCSPISAESYEHRTRNYKKHGVLPIWLLNTPVKKLSSKKEIAAIRLSQFEQLFIQSNDSLPFLVTFNPLTKTFYYLAHLLHVQYDQYIAKILTLPLEAQQFPFYNPQPTSLQVFNSLIEELKRLQRQMIQTRLKYSRLGTNDLLLRSFYELGLDYVNFPYYIGIPTRGSKALSVNTVEWQSGLFYFCKRYNLSISAISSSHILQYVQFIKQKATREKYYAVKAYVDCLKAFSISDTQAKVEHSKITQNVYAQLLQYG